MFDVFDRYATDENLEVEGVEVPLGDGAFIKVARADNERFNKMLVEVLEANAEKLDTLPEAESKKLDRQLYNEVLAETVLLGWKGMHYQGKPMKYSKANAIKLLEHRDFKKEVLQQAARRQHFKQKWEEADAKN